jgi:hypothetical protein
MSEIVFHFELEDGVAPTAMAPVLEERLAGLDGVEEAETAPEEQRMDVVEAAALVAGVVALARGGADLLAAVRAIIREVRGIVEELGGVRKAFVEIDGERVDVAELDDARLQQLAR